MFEKTLAACLDLRSVGWSRSSEALAGPRKYISRRLKGGGGPGQAGDAKRPAHLLQAHANPVLNMGIRNGKPPSPFGAMIGEKKANGQNFDFKICEANISHNEEDPVADFLDDVRKCVRKCSRLAELDECRIELEDNTYVAKVRVRVRASLNGSQGDVTLDAAIKDLCRGLMAAREGNRARLEILTDRSIWGIIPISSVFETYWTALFFNDILSNGPGRLESLAEEYMRASQPYCVPPLMVFGIATLFGMREIFDFMQSILGHSIDPCLDLPGFAMTALPIVSMVFRWFSRQRSSSNSLGNVRESFRDALTIFKRNFDHVLVRFRTIDGNTAPSMLRDLQWMHNASSELCRMSVSASELLTKKADLLEVVLVAMHEAHKKAATGAMTATFATIAAFGESASAAVFVSPLILVGIAIATGVIAWQHYKEGVKYKEECQLVMEVGAICHSAWANAFTIRLSLEWFRLHEGEDPTNLRFSNPHLQVKWEKFAREYRSRTRPRNQQHGSHAQLLGIWLKSEVEAMSMKRASLP